LMIRRIGNVNEEKVDWWMTRIKGRRGVIFQHLKLPCDVHSGAYARYMDRDIRIMIQNVNYNRMDDLGRGL
jgi:hypothetical protein